MYMPRKINRRILLMPNSSWQIYLYIIIVSGLSICTLQIFLSDYVQRNDLPLMIWWTNFMPESTRNTECHSKFTCLVTSDKSYKHNANLGVYLFYGSHLQDLDYPLLKDNIPWAVFHEESPKNYAPFLFKEVQDLFNVTSTFSRYSSFPLTLQYLTNLSILTDNRYFVPVEQKNILAPVLYIQSDCDTPIDRDYLIKELMQYINVDSYGKCLNNQKFPRELSGLDPLDLYNENYLKFISKYKFIIAFENALCDDYITEKLWRPLIVGSIPIYLGSPTVEDWLPNNSSAILVKDFSSIKSVAEFIHKVNDDDELYNSFLKHKISRKVSNNLLIDTLRSRAEEDPVLGFECFICQKLHEKTISNEKENIFNVYDCPKPVSRGTSSNSWDQHWDIGRCQARALAQLIGSEKQFTNEAYEELWRDLLIKKNC